MWEKRIAIVATMYHIKKGSHDLTIELALNNLNHSHDLMHKANGWLLREMGKKDEEKLMNFLKTHYQNMPRTSLREAFQLQRMFERDARGGTRYIEILKSHFGVTSPDFRLQRPEYLGGGSTMINTAPIPQTSSTDATTPQGNLAAMGSFS